MRGIGWIHSLICIISYNTIYCQSRYDYTWVLGYNYTDSLNGGFEHKAEGMILDFNRSPPEVSIHPTPFEMLSISVISHPETGRLQYYTNGCRIINADHETMDGGDSLNYSTYYKYYCDIGINGFHGDFNGILSLPAPGKKDMYYVLHRPSEIELPNFRKIWYSVIDMSKNEGKGRVTQKNIPILENLNLSLGYNTACKHANGRDWWILAWQRDEPKCYVLLLDDTGIRYHHTQMIGDKGPRSIGQAVFSQDGGKYMWYDVNRGLSVYDFDRTTGLLSNAKSLIINEPYQYGFGGVTISPNGRFAYLSARYKLFQLDLQESDHIDGLLCIDSIDYITPLGIRLNFSNSMLGPDCQIYISTGFAWYFYHIIRHPDEKGTACGLEKMALTLPYPNSNSAIPNNPHYRMDEAEVCNPRITSIFPVSWYRNNVLIYPNPSSDLITIETSQLCQIEMYDITGHKVLTTGTSYENSTYVDIADLKNGLYFVKCTTSPGGVSTHKFVKQ